MKHVFKTYQSLIENTLARQDFDRDPEGLYQPIRYILSLGGKRLRPALCLAACDLFEGSLENALMPALSLEVFHNFTLVHDDIMDASEYRRGKKTVHKKWDQNTAILSGDAMLIKAYQYLAKADKKLVPALLEVFSKTALEICEGQQLDVDFEQQAATSEEDYLEMIRLKTAVLLGCALKMGAILAKAPKKSQQELYEFGILAGMAFQVQDDLLDLSEDQVKVGKTEGGDILNDKQTLLSIYAREANAKGWHDLQAQNLQGGAKVKAWKQFFERSGSIAKTKEKRDTLLDDALSHLKKVSAQNAALKADLAQYTTWLAHREY